MKKIAHVKQLLQASPMSVKDLMAQTGISKATAYSLPYYLGKQGFKVTKGENAAKEATYHITAALQPVNVAKKTKKAPKAVEANEAQLVAA